MKKIIKIGALLISELSGFLAAIFGYEVFKIATGTPYTKGLFGLDIPYLYQTEKIYFWYCLFLAIGFLLLCVVGVITSLRNKKWIPVLVSVLFLVFVFMLLLLNGRYVT